MKLFIEQSDLFAETEIHIKCAEIDSELQCIIDELQTLAFSLSVTKDGAVCKLLLNNIFYFESVDEKTFVYAQEEVYECSYKLYEIEDKFGKYGFARISKSVVVNIRKIQQIKPQLNGRFDALLDNGEHVVVNRHYVSKLKEKFV